MTDSNDIFNTDEILNIDVDALKAKAIENRPHVMLFAILKNLRDEPELYVGHKSYRDNTFADAFKCLEILSKKFDEPKAEKSCSGNCACSKSKARDPFKAKGCPSSCKHNVEEHVEP